MDSRGGPTVTLSSVPLHHSGTIKYSKVSCWFWSKLFGFPSQSLLIPMAGTLKQSFWKPSEEERLTWKLCFLQQESKQKASRRAKGSEKQLLFFPCSVWKKNSFENSGFCKVFSVTIYQFLSAVDWQKKLNLWWSRESTSPLWQCTPGLVSCINYIQVLAFIVAQVGNKTCFQENLLICKTDRGMICLLQRRCLYLLMDKRQ